MNTDDFFYRFPELTLKRVTKKDFAQALEEILPINIFDLMVESDSSIFEMVKECLVESLWEIRQV